MSFPQQLVYYNTALFACQQLFSTFFEVFSSISVERRRRDLNPRAATNDLLPFQGSPFNHLGTSAIWLNHIPFGTCIQFSVPGTNQLSSVYTVNGESGIRTHAPFRTNGFQDRLVMTTSISLQAFSQTYFCILFHISCFVKRFFQSFFFFCYILENTILTLTVTSLFSLVFTRFFQDFHQTEKAVFLRFITLKTAYFLRQSMNCVKIIPFCFSKNFPLRSYPPAL